MNFIVSPESPGVPGVTVTAQLQGSLRGPGVGRQACRYYTVTARVTVIGPARRAPDGHRAECRLELDIAAGNPRLGLDFKIYR